MVIRNQRYECPKCGNSTPIVLNQRKREIRPPLNNVDVIEQTSSRTEKVSQRCPQCTNNQAFRWYSYSSGEHAGVKQDRIVEHFQCTHCGYIWGESR
jgi:DNA-directed RNA polymerase subunit M/transcription elongation factor TFIIS